MPSRAIPTAKINRSRLVINNSGTNIVEHKTNVKLFPNPTSNHMILFTGDLRPDIKIFDLNGKLVFARNSIDAYQRLNKSEIGTGMYFYSLTKGEEIVQHGKIIFE